jgi:hypothetical protein
MSARLALVSAVVAVLSLSPARARADAMPQGSEPPWPHVASVSPSAGPPGTVVTIEGLNFLPGAEVTAGGAAAEVREVAGDRIVAVMPPHGPGRVSVEVRNPDNRNGVRGWAFRYVPAGG